MRREVYLSQTRTRQKTGEGGGWVGASSSRRIMQVACAFRSSHERERRRRKEERKKDRKRKQYINKSFRHRSVFRIQGKKRCPRETQLARNLGQKELSHLHNLRTRQRKKRAQAKKKEQHSVLFTIPLKDRNNPHGVQQILSQQLSERRPKPRRTLQNKQTRIQIQPSRDKEKIEQHYVLFLMYTRFQNSSRLGADSLRDENSSSRTLSQGEPFTNIQSMRRKHPEQQKREKRAAFRAVSK